MTRSRLGFLWAALLFGTAPAAAADPLLRDGNGAVATVPAPGIMLFWAIWCAPCRQEIDDLAALERAAAPLPVIVVSLESDRRSRRALRHIDPAKLRFADEGGMAYLQRWTDGAVGLPIGIAVDRQGRRCVLKYGQVSAAELESWRRACS